MNMVRFGLALLVLSAALAADAISTMVVDVTGVGAEKKTVSLEVDNSAFRDSLQRNLERSGLFVVKRDGSIRVTGANGAYTARGEGRQLAANATAGDEKAMRMAARRLADAMCQTYGNQPGFACDRVCFVKKEAGHSEVCACYPDGYDVAQLTHDGKAALGPRWRDSGVIYYIGYLDGVQQIYELDLASGRHHRAWNIKGVSSPAVVSPDGTKVALVASFQGNPDLYILAGGKFTRLTNTRNVTEGQPSWSPDGKEIVYVSDESRRPQLYVIDVATRKTRRLTSRGSQNVDPDWGPDGRIAYVARGKSGAQIAVLDPAEGDKTAVMVTEGGNWEHPSWSRDARNLVASRDRALFVVDTEMVDASPNKPRQLFAANGTWLTPCWSRVK